MILKFVSCLLSYTLVSGQGTTTLSSEDLKLKLTFGADFGASIDHEIPTYARTVSF